VKRLIIYEKVKNFMVEVVTEKVNSKILVAYRAACYSWFKVKNPWLKSRRY